MSSHPIIGSTAMRERAPNRPLMFGVCTLLLLSAVRLWAAQSQPQIAQAEAPSLERAEKEFKLGQLEATLKTLDSLSSKAPSARSSYLRGLAFYQQGNMAAATQAFSEASRLDPKDLEAMKMEGASLYRSGHAAEAIPLLEHADVTSQQNNVDPQYVLGLCYMDTARYDDARRAFASQYRFDPESAPAYLLEARILLRRDLLELSAAAARRALALKSDIPGAHLLLGQLALAQANPQEAIQQFLAERTLAPLEGTVYDRLGDAYIRAGDYTAAQQALDQAIILEPTLNIPYILLAKALLEKQAPWLAVPYLQHALEIDNKNTMAHALLGRAYRELGRREEAATELRTAARLQTPATAKPETSPER
jgi:tetratricopeptide (TPR) repeat protein